MKVIPVAGYDSFLLNLSGGHLPIFTRNLIILEDDNGQIGVGETPGGEGIRQTLEQARDQVDVLGCLFFIGDPGKTDLPYQTPSIRARTGSVCEVAKPSIRRPSSSWPVPASIASASKTSSSRAGCSRARASANAWSHSARRFRTPG